MSYTDDFYIKEAHRIGVRARSYFKLEEIDKKFGLIQAGNKIVDLGAAPGAWCEYCIKKTKGHLALFAIDLLPIKPFNRVNQQTNQKVEIITGDIFKIPIEDFPNKVDLLLSDMAPKTTGIHVTDASISHELVYKAFDLAKEILKKDGSIVAKIFQSEETNTLINQYKGLFKEIKRFKPKSSRKNSLETFIIAKHKK